MISNNNYNNYNNYNNHSEIKQRLYKIENTLEKIMNLLSNRLRTNIKKTNKTKIKKVRFNLPSVKKISLSRKSVRPGRKSSFRRFNKSPFYGITTRRAY